MGRKRKGLSKKTRFEIFKRDGFKCQYCGNSPPAVILEIDHITSVANGGDDSEINLLTSCKDCNSGKGARSLEQVPESLAAQIEEQRERKEQVEACNQFLMEMREWDEERIKELGRYWYNLFMSKKDQYIFGPARVRSVRNFLKSLAPAELLEAMDLAHTRVPAYSIEGDEKTWKYFCGVCWRKIRPSNE